MKGKGAGRAPQRMLIVDGYNIINARRSGGMDSYSLADAREKLLSDLMDYAGYSAQQVVLVFDAWGEIADRYIERLCDELAGDIELHRLEVRVASSDALEQTIILGRGATRMSARELMIEMDQLRNTGIRQVIGKPVSRRNPIGERLSPEVRERLEQMRKGYNNRG